MTSDLAPPIDPLRPVVNGRYEDDVVVVSAIRGARPRRALRSVRTEHFDVVATGGRLVVSHTVPPEAIDDDLAGMIVGELFGPGWVRGVEVFERIFTGVVRTSRPDALDSWELFYGNTLRRLREPRSDVPGAHGSIAGYAPVYDHACGQVQPGSVLELGCCFGFLSIRLARLGHAATATDISPGTVRLLEAVVPRLGVRIATQVADAARVGLPDGAADTVLMIHLLEHLDPDHGARALDEAVRLARRRVVVAVPLEDEADEAYGHVRTITLNDLRTWGLATGLPHDVHEYHGGWLVIER